MFKLNFFDKKELESHMCMICLELKKSDIVSCSKCKSGYVCNNRYINYCLIWVKLFARVVAKNVFIK